MPTFVLDASAMIAFLCDEDGADVVEGLLVTPGNLCAAHSINLCEVFYSGIRDYDEPTASSMLNDLKKAGVREFKTMSIGFWKRVGVFRQAIRAAKQPIALADCFGIVLAQDLAAAFVTADHRELDYVFANNLARINFIR